MDRVAGTARWTAAERARESARADRLFEDPFAEALAGDEGRALADLMRGDGAFDNPGIAVRTRFFDDVLRDSLDVHGRALQVVALAAGMDARSYRLELPPELTWYELDRADLLALKDGVLAEIDARPRCTRRTVGVDLADQWAEPLAAAGFEPSQPTIWLAEGLIFYLDTDTVHHLLDEITRTSAPGSELLIDTIGQSVLDSPQMRPWCQLLAEQGTPWRFGTDQPEKDLLLPRGWQPRVSMYSEVGAQLARWPFPALPRDTPNAPQSFLVHASRQP